MQYILVIASSLRALSVAVSHNMTCMNKICEHRTILNVVEPAICQVSHHHCMYMWSHYPTQIRNKFNINHWAVTTPTFTTLKKWEWPGDEAGVDIVAAAGN